jgi:energy-coupling factor transporter transmembrane protein EcfT
MTSFEVDLHAGIDSPLHKLDPRAKIVALTAAVVAVSSTPATGLPAFPWYYSLIALLVGLSRIPPGWLLLRCLITSPFILMAAGLPAFSLWVEGEPGPGDGIGGFHASRRHRVEGLCGDHPTRALGGHHAVLAFALELARFCGRRRFCR